MASWGAALQGSIKNGDIQDCLLLSQWHSSIGVETEGGLFTKLVERNTTVPTERKQVFSTEDTSPATFAVRIYEGERPMAADNELIGAFVFKGSGMEVKIDIDADCRITAVIGFLDTPQVTHALPYIEKLVGDFDSLRIDCDDHDLDE